MKRCAFLLCMAAAAVLSGCGLLPIVKGSGFTVTTPYSLAGFTHVMAEQNCKVLVVPDSVTSITVTSDDNLVPYLTVQMNGPDSLMIGLRHGYIYTGTTFSAEVHVPALAALDMSGASQVIVKPGLPAATAFSVTLSGASTADLQQLTAGALSADISGASSLTAAGTAASINATLSGASTAHLLDMPAGSARADLSGASECWIAVSPGPVDLTASGASTLYYRGSPQIRMMDLSGASRLVNVN